RVQLGRSDRQHCRPARGGDSRSGEWALAPVRLPPLDAVTAIVAVFERRGWPVAVGGSAVLAWLGLVDTVRDWDVTVDADPDEVRQALLAAGFEPEDRTSHEHPFATRRRLVLTLADHEIDVLVGFAL